MHHIALYELGRIIQEERLEEARRFRLARPAQSKTHRRPDWTKRERLPQFRLRDETAPGCVACPSPSV